MSTYRGRAYCRRYTVRRTPCLLWSFSASLGPTTLLLELVRLKGVMSLDDCAIYEQHIPARVSDKDMNHTLVSLTDGSWVTSASFGRVRHVSNIQSPCCITSSNDSCCGWSNVCLLCWDRFCNEVMRVTCHGGSQPLSPRQYTRPRCNPSGCLTWGARLAGARLPLGN